MTSVHASIFVTHFACIPQVPYEHTLVDPANKPQDFKDLYASIVHNTDDSAKVPIIVGKTRSPAAACLAHAASSEWSLLPAACCMTQSARCCMHADGDDKVTESLIAVEYLDAKHGGELLPKSPLELANVCPILHPSLGMA